MVGKKPMCGPRIGSSSWKKMIARDVRIQNLAKARAVRASKSLGEEKGDVVGEVITND